MARILIGDPIQTHREALEETLRIAGYYVDAVDSGSAVLDRLECGKFDIALLELRLPSPDGIAILEQLKHSDRDMVPILFSGNANIGFAMCAAKLGAFDFWEKPLNDTYVIRALGRIIASRYPPRHKLAREMDKFLYENATDHQTTCPCEVTVCQAPDQGQLVHGGGPGRCRFRHPHRRQTKWYDCPPTTNGLSA